MTVAIISLHLTVLKFCFCQLCLKSSLHQSIVRILGFLSFVLYDWTDLLLPTFFCPPPLLSILCPIHRVAVTYL
ncbi:hypothetical protein M758_4G106600 [Ceratodon purpureus]|nr:hypothetical protein M758_4G106600 [Ceratodon purpureus]